MTDSKLLTAAQVAALAQVSVRTVHRWAISGRLRIAQRLPGETGALLFREQDVTDLLTPAEVAQ